MRRLTQQEAEYRVIQRGKTKDFICKPFVYKNNKTRLYLTCNKCGNEWNTSFMEISNGTACPACNGTHLLTQQEAEELLVNKCNISNYAFKSFIYDGCYTNIDMICHCSYEWKVKFIEITRNKEKGCPKCSGKWKPTQQEAENEIKLICNENNWKYKPFIYINNITKIDMICNCGNEWTATFNMLQRRRGCPACVGKTQQYAYIHSVLNGIEQVAIKYGIETVLGRRHKEQNSRCLYDIDVIDTYKFETSEQCKNAEKECIKLFKKENKKLFGRKGYVTKEEMKDGWSETTSVSNIDKIIKIYEKWGGVKVNGKTLALDN